MLWATRRGCHVDRTACVWLIRRFVDGEATFSFFEDPAEAPEGAEPAAGQPSPWVLAVIQVVLPLAACAPVALALQEAL